jgi:CheY-like chemotaxis protein
VNLPRRNGFEVLAEIRATESLHNIPVIIFTSASLATERKRALALGGSRLHFETRNVGRTN